MQPKGQLCNVLNCGQHTLGHCVHEWTGTACPHCGHEMIRVITTGFTFCSNHEMVCGYEEEAK